MRGFQSSTPGRRADLVEGMRRTAGVVMVAFVTLVSLACSPRTTERPASAAGSRSKDIFADVHGWVAYGDTSGIWAVDPENPGNQDDRVLLSPRVGTPVAWSSDGSKLLFQTGHNLLFPGPRKHLIVLNSDGTEAQLTRDSDGVQISGGSFTPDGSKVVYATAWGKSSGIYMVSSEGGMPRLLLAAGRRWVPEEGRFNDTSLFHPTLSPDGSQIAYFDGHGDWGNTLWIMDADGSNGHQLEGIEADSHVGGLEWSPDGTRLAFDSGNGTYVVNADGSGLSHRIVNAWNPHWSPDGSRIAYAYLDRGLPRACEPAPTYSCDLGKLTTAAPDGTQVRFLGVSDTTAGPWNPLEPEA